MSASPPPRGKPRKRKPPPRRRSRLLRAAAASLLGLLFLLGAAALFLESRFDAPADPADKRIVLFRVPPGTGMRRVAEGLAEKSVIRSAGLFRLQVRLRGGARRIQSGYYEFSPSMSPRQIYEALTAGRVAQRSVTIPEGQNLREMERVLVRKGFVRTNELLRLARDPDFLASLGVEAGSLEGYLFPDTYLFPVGTSPRQILRKMHETMQRKLDAELARRPPDHGLTRHEVLTLASLVEKETSIDAERPLIAGVFMNRLRRNMRLQSDPTVIYALPEFDGNLRKKDLAYDSPYNTYRHRGLPPGPIASPGLPSIRAALFPARVDYLYFVAMKDGRHKFSRSYSEHRSAIRKYQIRRER